MASKLIDTGRRTPGVRLPIQRTWQHIAASVCCNYGNNKAAAFKDKVIKKAATTEVGLSQLSTILSV